MDSIVAYWQQIVSLAIVALTAVIMVRSSINRRRNKHACGTCALAAARMPRHEK